MSKNVDLVLAGFDTWNRQDLKGWLAMLAPDVEFWTSGVFPDFEPVYRGQRGAVEFWRRLHDPWETLLIEPDGIEERGDWVAVAFRFRAKGAGSGIDVDLGFANAVQVLGDHMIRIYARQTLTEARDIAGGEQPTAASRSQSMARHSSPRTSRSPGRSSQRPT